MTQTKIYFYSKDEQYGEFSNFAPFGIEMNDRWYPTVEHYFQSMKFQDTEYSELIRLSKTPKAAAELGRSRKYPILSNWDEVKIEIMYLAVKKKFITHSNLTELLISTQNKEIIENSPYDHFWGCGYDGTGQNHLGKILMKVREFDLR